MTLSNGDGGQSISNIDNPNPYPTPKILGHPKIDNNWT